MLQVEVLAFLNNILEYTRRAAFWGKRYVFATTFFHSPKHFFIDTAGSNAIRGLPSYIQFATLYFITNLNQAFDVDGHVVIFEMELAYIPSLDAVFDLICDVGGAARHPAGFSRRAKCATVRTTAGADHGSPAPIGVAMGFLRIYILFHRQQVTSRERYAVAIKFGISFQFLCAHLAVSILIEIGQVAYVTANITLEKNVVLQQFLTEMKKGVFSFAEHNKIDELAIFV